VKKKIDTQMHILHILKLSTKQYNSRAKPWVSLKLKTPIKMQDETMPRKETKKKKKKTQISFSTLCVLIFLKKFMHLHVHLRSLLMLGNILRDYTKLT
jgi:hypothetical protein